MRNSQAEFWKCVNGQGRDFRRYHQQERLENFEITTSTEFEMRVESFPVRVFIVHRFGVLSRQGLCHTTEYVLWYLAPRCEQQIPAVLKVWRKGL